MLGSLESTNPFSNNNSLDCITFRYFFFATDELNFCYDFFAGWREAIDFLGMVASLRLVLENQNAMWVMLAHVNGRYKTRKLKS